MIWQIPGYEIDEIIHSKEHGAVCHAFRKSDGLPAVIKMQHFDANDPRELRRLRRSFDIMHVINHPNIVMAHEFIETEEGLALICEDFGGTSLNRLVGHIPNFGAFLDLAIAMCDAVASVHALHYVHKDLKPANFIYNAARRMLKLTDFGLAAHLPYGTQAMDPSDLIEGTFAFISPEQTGRLNRGIDTRADLYSLGVTFYQLLTGHLPFHADDPLGWVHCHVAREPISPLEVMPSLPPILAAIILRLMKKMPDDRYQTVGGLKHDLKRLAVEGFQTEMALGTQDISGRFQISQKLHGRSMEQSLMLDAFQNLQKTDRKGIVTVAGYSGIGKSSLVNELQKPIVEHEGFFIAGKFDQFKRDIPLATVVEALRSLVHQVLTVSEDKLNNWRDRIRESMGNTGRVMTDLIPEMTLIVGEQPPLPILGPLESQNRFKHAFITFLKVFARAEHPLVIFLDDMQWADPGTLSLIEMIVGRKDVTHMLFILAYRDNEVTPTHPFKIMLDGLPREDTDQQAITLGSLPPGTIAQMISDTLGCPQDLVQPLATLVHAKTEGNPFFANEFLKMLYEMHILEFSPQNATWTWDESRIAEKDLSGNVVELMISRLRRLPDPCQHALELGSLIGISFSLNLLATINSSTFEKALAELAPALDAGLIRVSGDPYDRMDLIIRFQHDRIHQVASMLVPEADKSRLHGRIGRLLLNRTAAHKDPPLFDIVNHLNAARSLIKGDSEKRELFQLNIQAGRKAKSATSYRTALHYFNSAQELIDPQAWIRSYRDTLEVFLDHAECLYLGGELNHAEAMFQEILKKSADLLDRARVYYLQIKLYQVAGRYADAANLALASFAEFGMVLPTDDAAAGAMMMQDVEWAGKNATKDRDIPSLVNLPALTDPKIAALMGLLEASAPPFYMDRPALFPVVVMKIVVLSLEHGNCETSAYGYAVYAILLAAAFEDVPGGYAFLEMAIALNQQLNDSKLRGALLHMYGDHVNFWAKPMATNQPALEKGFAACLEAGDLIYSNYIGFQGVWQCYERGESLDDMIAFAEPYKDYAKQSGHEANALTIQLEQNFALALLGETLSPTSLSTREFDAGKAMQVIEEARYTCGVVYYHIMRLILCYLDDKYEDAMICAAEAEKTLSAALSMPIQPTYYFYRALTQAARVPQLTNEARSVAVLEITDIHQKFVRWSVHCPENFAARAALLEAELGRVTNATRDTINEAYAQAMRLAATPRNIPIKALGRELHARYLLSIHDRSGSARSLSTAISLYETWGVVTRLETLKQQMESLDPGPTMIYAPTSTGTSATRLDILAVLKASQSISSEIKLDSLLQKLIDVLLVISGAESGGLVLFNRGEGRLEIFVDGTRDSDAPGAIATGIALNEAGPFVPLSLINYVSRVGKRVLIDDTNQTHIFANDPYFALHNPKSLLCMPIFKQQRNVGVLLLVNQQAPGAFTANRIDILEPLLAQVVTSLENASLFTQVQAQEQQLRLITDSLPALVFSLEGGRTFMFANSSFQRWFNIKAAAVHGLTIIEVFGPAVEEILRPHLNTVMSGKTVEVETTLPFLNSSRRDVLVNMVPEWTQGKVTGIVALAHDVTERRRQERERTQMQASTQAALEASRLKSEFVANMSHEIRTPINGVMGMADLLLDTQLTAEQKDFVETINTSARQLLSIVNEVLDFSKIEAGKLELERINMSLNDVLHETIKPLVVLAANKKLVLTLENEAIPLPVVRGDPVRIKQIITNLVNNAIKFTEKGQVTVKATTKELDRHTIEVLIAVRDTGIGMSEETRRGMFQAFSQADVSTTRKYGGTGLGLSICKRLVDLMEGTIKVESRQGHGSTFSVQLKLPKGAAAQRTKPSQKTKAPSAVGTARLLLVEDNPINQKIAVTMLEKLGYQMTVSNNGREALKALSAESFDLILMDCHMPEMDGYSASQAIRRGENGIATDTPIIAMTANAIEGDREKCLAAGMDDYISKPIDRQLLATKVAQWLVKVA